MTQNILDPGYDLTLRPMRYPHLYDYFLEGIQANWTVEEVNLSSDVADLDNRLTVEEQHLVKRLVAFFATGDTIVSNNLVINLYTHLNSPEARMFLSRQLFEEANHIHFYLTLLDTYIPDLDERVEAFRAVDEIPSIRTKAEFCQKWIDHLFEMKKIENDDDARRFLLGLICFAACVEGLFFYASFAYVYFLRDKGLLTGLADGTNWVFADESRHMNFAFAVVDIVRREQPHLFTAELEEQVKEMMAEAIECERLFAIDALSEGITGLSVDDIHQYLRYTADSHLETLGFEPCFGGVNPLTFMELQNVQSTTNFFERTPTEYKVGVSGGIDLEATF